MNYLLDGSDAQPTQPATQNNHYGDLAGCSEALWRTFLCNITGESIVHRPGDKDAIALIDVPLLQDHWTWIRTEEIFYSFILYNHLFRKPLGQYFTHKTPNCQKDIRQRTKKDSQEESLMERAVINICGNRLFTTRMGLIGICPPSAKSGDLVSVLLGCSVPLVLRPHGDNFRVIGEYHAQGIMEGEVITSGKINRNKIQGIELC